MDLQHMSLTSTLVYINGHRLKHLYSNDFTGWLRMVPTEEIEDIIGREAMNRLVANFEIKDKREG